MKTQRRPTAPRAMRELELCILSQREPFTLEDLAPQFPHIPRPSVANKMTRMHQEGKLSLDSRGIVNKRLLHFYSVRVETMRDAEERLFHLMGSRRYEDVRLKPNDRTPLTHLLYGAGLPRITPSKDMQPLRGDPR